MSGYTTLFKWNIPYLKSSALRYTNGEASSDTFKLNSDPSVLFALHFKFTTGYVNSPLKIVLKEKKKEGPIELSAKVWLEDKDGTKFGEQSVETHTFETVNDECVFFLPKKASDILLKIYKDDSSVSFCCQIEDPWGASHQCPLSQKMWELHISGLEVDIVTLQVDGKNIEVSQNVLMMHSDVFKSMFTSNFEESRTKKIDIKDVEAPAVEALVKWMYLQTIRNEDVVTSLFALADKYMIPDLKAQCSDILPRCLTEENAARCLVLSIKYKDEKLKKYVTGFIHQKGEDAWLKIMQSNTWADFVSEQRSMNE